MSHLTIHKVLDNAAVFVRHKLSSLVADAPHYDRLAFSAVLIANNKLHIGFIRRWRALDLYNLHALLGLLWFFILRRWLLNPFALSIFRKRLLIVRLLQLRALNVNLRTISKHRRNILAAFIKCYNYGLIPIRQYKLLTYRKAYRPARLI